MKNMEDKKSTVKLYSSTYGVITYAMSLAVAGFCFLIGIILLPNEEGIAIMGFGLFFVLLSFCLIHFKYLNYITLTDKGVSTKKQTFSWDEVNITVSYYKIHYDTRREDYYIFFDNNFLSKEEIYSRRVKKDAFFIMLTPDRLELIMQYYHKRIRLLDRCGIDRKRIYDKINEYNLALYRSQKYGQNQKEE